MSMVRRTFLKHSALAVGALATGCTTGPGGSALAASPLQTYKQGRPSKEAMMSQSCKIPDNLNNLAMLDSVRIPYAPGVLDGTYYYNDAIAVIGISVHLYFDDPNVTYDDVSWCYTDYLKRVFPYLKRIQYPEEDSREISEKDLNIIGNDIVYYDSDEWWQEWYQIGFFSTATSTNELDSPAHYNLQIYYTKRGEFLGLNVLHITFPVGFLLKQNPRWSYWLCSGQEVC